MILKEGKGITLVALVITMIILLILARDSNIKINRKWTFRKSTIIKRRLSKSTG